MIGWLLRKVLDAIDPHDEKAVMQKRPVPSEPYDYQKANAGYYRAKARTETGRLLAKPKRRQHDNVVPMRKVGR